VDGQPSTFQQRYHRDRVRALLTCFVGSCGVDVCVLGKAAPTSARLEVILQPRGRDGLPQGHARCLFEATVLLYQDERRRASGYVRLPFHLDADVLRHCHLRITPLMMEASANKPDENDIASAEQGANL
jgi:hypothetical protein